MMLFLNKDLFSKFEMFISLVNFCAELYTTYGNFGIIIRIIRVLKVPFPIFDKLKNEIQKFMIRFCFYLNKKNEIQIIDYYFHVKIDFYFEFLMLSFVFHFHKKNGKRNTVRFPFFIFKKELKNELLNRSS